MSTRRRIRQRALKNNSLVILTDSAQEVWKNLPSEVQEEIDISTLKLTKSGKVGKSEIVAAAKVATNKTSE